jgi:hypothetical protein
MSVVNKWDPTHFVVLFAPVGVGRKSISTLRKEAIRPAEQKGILIDGHMSVLTEDVRHREHGGHLEAEGAR